MTLWILLFAMCCVTVSLRTSFLLLPPQVQLPAPLRRALRFVPAAVLTAIFAPELTIHGGRLDLSFGNEKLLAGLVAIGVAWRLRNAFVTILAGMLALHLFVRIA